MWSTAIIILLLAVALHALSYDEWRTQFHIKSPPSDAEQYWFTQALQSIETLKVDSPHAIFRVGPSSGTPWGIPKAYPKAMAALQNITFSDAEILAASQASRDWQMTQDTSSSGAVTRIKNQGACGSCYVFSTVATIEGMHKISNSNNSLLALSEQYILDCVYKNNPNICNGGNIRDLAQALAGSNFSLPLERNYEYLSYDNSTHTCNTSAVGVVSVASANQIGTIANQSLEDAMMAYVYMRGPIMIGVTAWQSAWQHYSSGIADCPANSNLDHAVTIVGYGSENGIPYWKIKNSWTPYWGESGYIRLRRGINACGLTYDNAVLQVRS